MMGAAGTGFLWISVLMLTAIPSAAAVSEMAILDSYLENFDTYRGAHDVWVTMVYDRCHRNGGTEDTSKLPLVASVDATNDLMFQHAKWHGDQGRFLEPVYTWSDSDPYGIEFLEYHRDLIVTYEDWRALHDYPVLVSWDPMTPIPEEFAYPVAMPCLKRATETPGIALPSFLTVGGGSDGSPFWGYTALCDIPDANRLGKTIEGSWYHADVHLTIGGDMAEAGLTLRDPIFWPWHKHVQGIYDTWMACASLQLDAQSGAQAKATPGVALPVGLIAVLWASGRVRRTSR